MVSTKRFNDRRNIDFENNLPQKKKVALILLAIFSLVIAVVWLIQVNYQIGHLFKVENSNYKDDVLEEMNLKMIDTDGDGISDYDELYVYSTSPYLEDTDGDGISDYDEVIQGTDPLCQEGKNCYSEDYLLNQEEEQRIFEELLFQAGDESEVAEILQDFSAGKVNPDNLRKILILGGMDPKELEEINDEDLMAGYEESLRLKDEMEQEDVELSALRQALIEAGYSEEDLDLISDEELLSSYQAAKSQESN